MPKLSLEKVLQSQGVGSRSACRAAICREQVRIGGAVADDPSAKYETDGLSFEYAGEVWLYRPLVYLALHKPEGYECSRRPGAHPSVFELLPERFEHRAVQPVGRLDFDTTGLLLLSDDGAFIHAQSSPKKHVPKTYVARTERPLTDGQLEALRSGVLLRDEEDPIAVVSCRRLGEKELELVLEQGKYHQVKRMIAAAGNHCAALRRDAVGSLTLEGLGLAPGAWTYLEGPDFK